MSPDDLSTEDDLTTATLRVPDVQATPAGAVRVELVPHDAAILAKVLIHYGVEYATHNLDGEIEGYDPDVWNQLAHRVLTEKSAIELGADAVIVPLRRSSDFLLELGPDEERSHP